MNERVRLEIKDQVAYVVMTRGDKLNALDGDMLEALVDTARAVGRDKSLRAVVLRGEGSAFCSGLDFASFAKQRMRMLRAFLKYGVKATNLFQEAAWCWRRLPVPVIAAIHGHCYGGGVQIALGADFRIITPDCSFSILEAKWGLVPDMTGTVTLRELLPIDQAKLLAMTGRMLNGVQARELNLVTSVSADPLAAAEELIAELKTRSPDAIAAAKRLFHETWTMSARRAFSKESRAQLGLLLGQNQKIATRANLKKEAPEFVPRR